MSHERLDSAFLPVLAEAGTALTTAQVRDRCDDPWAPPLTEQWLGEAFDRGLVNVRRQGDLPVEWKLSPRGRRLHAKTAQRE